MEFGVAPEILDALRARIDRRIFGYTGLYDDEYYHTFSNWCKDHYNWHFPKEQLCISPGIIPALYQLTEMLCTAGEKVLLNTPAYGYFLHAAEYAGGVCRRRCADFSAAQKGGRHICSGL